MAHTFVIHQQEVHNLKFNSEEGIFEYQCTKLSFPVSDSKKLSED